MCFQKYTIIVEAVSIPLSVSHLKSFPEVNVKVFDNWLIRPVGWNIILQIVAATTDDRTAGI